MKNQPYTINLSKVCRLCFVEKTDLSPIFDNSSIPDLSLKIKQCVSIEVSSGDQLPDRICSDCFVKIRNWITFKENCTEADTNLKNYVKTTFKEESGEEEENVENVDSYDSDNHILVNLLLSDESDDVKSTEPCDKSEEKSGKKSTRTKKYQSKQERRALYRQKYNQYQRKSYPCDICDKKFTRFCDLFNHDKMDHENLPRNSMCNVCGKLFVSENRVAIHKSRYHCEKPFTCDICEKKFLTKRTLQKHMIIHNKCFTCPYCNLSTSSNSSLIEHVRVHTREKPYTCDECGNSYISQQGLNSHKKTHSSEKLFMCDICGYSARNQSSIYIHKGSHSNVKPFICETCGKAFKSKIRLNEHHRRHTAVKRFTCDTCNISFRQNYQLIKHYRVHSGEKPYSCDICNKSFARSDSLKEHKRIHTGEKRYTCEVCLKAFSFLKPFKTHKCITTIAYESISVKNRSNSFVQPAFVQNNTSEENRISPDVIDTITEDVSMESDSTNQLISEETPNSSDKSLLFTCEICKETFTSSNDLVDHKVNCYLDSSIDSVIPSTADEPEVTSNESESDYTRESVDNEVQSYFQSSPRIRETDDSPMDVSRASPNFVNVPDDNVMVSKVEADVAREPKIIKNDNEFDRLSALRVRENSNTPSRLLIRTDIHREDVPRDLLTNHNLIVPESAADFVENPEVISHQYDPNQMNKSENEYADSFHRSSLPICKIEVLDSTPSDGFVDSKNAVFINGIKPDRSNELFHEEVSSLDQLPCQTYNGNEISNYSPHTMNSEYPLKNEVVTAEDFSQIVRNTVNEFVDVTEHKLNDFYDKSSRNRRSNVRAAKKPRSTRSNKVPYETEYVDLDSYQSHFLDEDRQNIRKPKRRSWRKPFYCDKCGKNFSTERGLLLHNRKLPFCENSVQFKCKKCEYSTHDSHNLKYHLKTTHLEGTFCCETCGKSFGNAIALLGHRRRVHLRANSSWKGNFICSYCKKIFLYKNTLQAHMRNHYIYQCIQCDKKFIDEKALRLHERFHTSSSILKCELCDFTTQSRMLINDHMLNVHGTVGSIRCKQCGESFKTKVARDQHCKSVHSGICCEQCGESFKNKSARDEHVISAHLMNKMKRTGDKSEPLMIKKVCTRDKSEPFICDYCKKSYITKAQLRSHIEWKHMIEECVCKICEKRFRSNPSLKQHHRLHHLNNESFMCEICNHKCNSYYHLQQHFEVHSGERQYVCPACKMRFTNKRSLEEHEITHENDGQFFCLGCQKYFTSRKILQEHIKIHIGQSADGTSKLYVCVDCGKTYDSYFKLTSHRKMHPGELNCSHCQKQCTSRKSLKCHLESHESKESFPCEICNELCVGKRALKVHLKTHKSVDIQSKELFACEICDFKCSLRDDLHDHLRTHVVEQPSVLLIRNETVTLENNSENNAGTRSFNGKSKSHTNAPKKSLPCEIRNEEPASQDHDRIHTEVDIAPKELYTCEICDISYENAARLEDHFGIHTGENNCKICFQTFDQKSALQNHLRIHKEIENATKKLFTCEICDQSCENAADLNDHFKIHTGEKQRYTCNICFKNFSSLDFLLFHKRSHSPEFIPANSKPIDTIVID